jgi:hypothetical protein
VICVRARTRDVAVSCPGCGTETARVHGYHVRTVADVPADGRRVLVRVRVRRMRCPVLGCPKQTFREQVPGVLGRYQRRTTLCVPKTLSTSCDQAIFVDQAIDARAFPYAVLVEVDRLRQRFQRSGCVQGAVRPVQIVMALVLAQDLPQMILVPDKGTVQQLTAASPDPAFSDRIHPRRPDAAEHGPDAGVGEDGVEGRGEVRSAVADHELDPISLFAEVHEQVPGLLGGPVPLQNPAATSDVRILDPVHAARWYSLMTPPSTLRRRTGASKGTTTGSS